MPSTGSFAIAPSSRATIRVEPRKSRDPCRTFRSRAPIRDRAWSCPRSANPGSRCKTTASPARRSPRRRRRARRRNRASIPCTLRSPSTMKMTTSGQATPAITFESSLRTARARRRGRRRTAASASSSVIVASKRCSVMRTARLLRPSSPTCGPRYSSKTRTPVQSGPSSRGDGALDLARADVGVDDQRNVAVRRRELRGRPIVRRLVRAAAPRRSRTQTYALRSTLERSARARVDAPSVPTSRLRRSTTPRVLPGWNPASARRPRSRPCVR